VVDDKQAKFLNIESHSESLISRGADKTFYSAKFNRSERLVVQNRRVYDSLQFLGDLGGVFGSMYLIGAVLHFLSTQSVSA